LTPSPFLCLTDYVDEGDPNGELLILIHGFPDLWYGWRYQIRHLVKEGYRVIAIDNLGNGETVR
jgi:pimeloyl-ACP methyl ester carboxylesterase